MKALLVSVVLAAAAFGGCLGGGGGGGGGNDPPEASFTVTPPTGEPGTEFTFDASAAEDPEGGALTFEWHFGDGATAEGVTAKHTYAGGAGTYPVTVLAKDPKGKAGLALQNVKVGSGTNTAPAVTVNATSQWIGVGESITFTANATDQDGDPLHYYWTVGPFDAEAGDDFDTGNLTSGGNVSETFDTVGIYAYHCHPHPWMKGLVIVEEGGSPAQAQVNISNFRFEPDIVRVPRGSTVTFENQDPTVHTATQETFHAGAPAAETSSAITQEFTGEGDYTVFVLVRDGKAFIDSDGDGKADGDAAGEAFGFVNVRVSAEPPSPVLDDSRPGSLATPIEALDPPPFYVYDFKFDAPVVEVELAWTTPAAAAVNMTLSIFPGSTPQGTHEFRKSGTATPIAGNLTLSKGPWTVQVKLNQGASVDFTFTLHAELDVVPEFGERAAGNEGHHH